MKGKKFLLRVNPNTTPIVGMKDRFRIDWLIFPYEHPEHLKAACIFLNESTSFKAELVPEGMIVSSSTDFEVSETLTDAGSFWEILEPAAFE